MQAVDNHLGTDAGKTAIGVLAQILSDEHVLVTKLRNYHWNVDGPSFRELHALFEEQYAILATRIDDVAERTRALGVRATGTMAEYLQQTTLREHPGSFPSAHQMIRNLLEDHDAVARYIRESLQPRARHIVDVGTIDLLTGLLRDHEKMSWQLSATLSNSGAEHHEHYPGLYDS
jgi:starvation-inducible DNA-binding protein